MAPARCEWVTFDLFSMAYFSFGAWKADASRSGLGAGSAPSVPPRLDQFVVAGGEQVNEVLLDRALYAVAVEALHHHCGESKVRALVLDQAAYNLVHRAAAL